jgi:hypothetical protein
VETSLSCACHLCVQRSPGIPSAKMFGSRFAAEGFGSFPPGGGRLAWGQKRGGEGMGACRRETTLGFGCWLDDGSEMLHALEAFALALAAEIKDEFTNSKATVRSNIRDDLLCRIGEGPTFEPDLTLCGQRDIVERGFIGDRERIRIAPGRLGQTLEVAQRDFQLMRPQRHRRIGTDRVPAIAIVLRPVGAPQDYGRQSK